MADALSVLDAYAGDAVRCDDWNEARIALAQLVWAAMGIQGVKKGDALLVPFERIADLAMAVARVQGAA